MFNTSSRLDQRFTGLLFGAWSIAGVLAVGAAVFDDRVDPLLVAASPAASAQVAQSAQSEPAAARTVALASLR